MATQEKEKPSRIEKGDAVVLSEFLDIEQRQDASGGKYWFAQRPWYSVADKKAPFTVFDVIVGVYVGMKYVPTRQHRRGVIQTALHGFFFNDQEVFIDPKHITVVSRFDASVG